MSCPSSSSRLSFIYSASSVGLSYHVSSTPESKTEGVHGCGEVSAIRGSVFHSSSVYGRNLMYGSPCLVEIGILYPSRDVIDGTLPVTFRDLLSTLTL
jgi:hypothetical protein